MKLYRFSPISTQDELMEALNYIHTACHELCEVALGEELPVVGLIGYFCHYSEECSVLKTIQRTLTQADDAVNGKYFRLLSNLEFGDSSYEYLYIRQPDPYRHHVGDLDFNVSEEKYEEIKKHIEVGDITYARVYESDTKRMIELFHPDYDVLAYVTTREGGVIGEVS